MTDAIQAAAYRVLEGTGTMDDAVAVSLAYFRMITARAGKADAMREALGVTEADAFVIAARISLAPPGSGYSQEVRLLASAFVEKVRRAAIAGSGSQPSLYTDGYYARRIAAGDREGQPSRDEVLEEAAKVADTETAVHDAAYEHRESGDENAQDRIAARSTTAKRIADAIRALKSPAAKVTP